LNRFVAYLDLFLLALDLLDIVDSVFGQDVLHLFYFVRANEVDKVGFLVFWKLFFVLVRLLLELQLLVPGSSLCRG
jgi:hypothetical protein